ncbi:MAG: heavy metal translocating P-type ATPase metal-binding domain-containing protein [Myxococcota bacterium]
MSATTPTPATEVAHPETARCLHCAQPILDSSVAPFCCRGCRSVHRILQASGLERYYELRRGPGLPPVDTELTPRDHKWLEVIEESRISTGATRVLLDIQGIHCTACVWLIEEVFRRHAGTKLGTISLNPTLGRIELRISPEFALSAWVRDVEELGYALGPERSAPGDRESDGLLIRVGICVALAANVMLFAAAIYVGLEEGPVYRLLNQLSYAAGVVSVLVGGSVFFRAAIAALKRRVLHLDVPIALGIGLAFVGSTWSFFFDSGDAIYMDTLTVFVALMLVGRWLQQRVLERNRAQLLADDGTEGLLTRQVRDGVVRIVHCVGVREGDELLIAPGDLVPVDLLLAETGASCSLDWIDGESTPRSYDLGETVPAGAFNVSSRAFVGVAACDFSSSGILGLLGRDSASTDDGTYTSKWWARVSKYYVIGVVTLAASATAYWTWAAGPLRAIEVATAVLVVTCPCAFGIAAPLAYELILNRLRRAGVFIRSSDLLDRLRGVDRVVFDKTGTLTTGVLEVRAPKALMSLPDEHISILYNLVARSAHPKSVAVRRAIEGHPAARLRPFAVEEHMGLGVSLDQGSQSYQLGSPGWTSGTGSSGDLSFAVNGREIVSISTAETLRPDAVEETRGLRNAAYELTILSGDAPIRVKALGAELGFAPEACLGAQSPTGKAEYVAAHDPARTLLVGDGLNDRVAMQTAACSGTPAVNRPFMASRCDFYFVSPGLRPVAQVLRASQEVTQLVRQLLMFAVAYNAIAVSIAMAGLMKPWIAAVLMPLSSLVTLGYTVAVTSKRGKPWTS